MPVLLHLAQLLLYIGLLALAGQGLLHVLAGSKRDSNFFYQLFQVINRPWLGLARRLAPRLAPRHHGWLAALLTGLLYGAVTWARIAHCLSVAMQGCR